MQGRCVHLEKYTYRRGGGGIKNGLKKKKNWQVLNDVEVLVTAFLWPHFVLNYYYYFLPYSQILMTEICC